MANGFTLEGDREMAVKLTRLARKFPAETAQALFQEAEKIIVQADEVVPRLSGDLADSKFVDDPIISMAGSSVQLGYTADHAVAVHFRQDITHEVGEALWFANTLADRQAGMINRIRGHVGQNVKVNGRPVG